jgi:hypothetical protein
MLDFVKSQIAANAEPWVTALNRAMSSASGKLSYTPHPRAIVECGSSSNPDYGCTDEKNDAAAAYTQALLWYHTGNGAYAQKAIEILNAWSSTVTGHTNTNAPLQAAWTAEVFPRAAEILRYSDAGWAESDIERFAEMLRNVYLPLIQDGSKANGNWELSMIEGMMNIGIFINDQTVFSRALQMWRERVPAYIYLESDGPTPVPPPPRPTVPPLIAYWQNQTVFADGICQETCRDFGHVQYGLAALINAAETAQIQGVDLYSEQAIRIQAGLEFHAQFLDGVTKPDWLCSELKDLTIGPTWEIAANEYVNRRRTVLPHTQAIARARRPTGSDHHMVWETLTHAELGAAGL